MPRYRLTIEYDGAPFAGWQRQAEVETVQGRIERAFTALGAGADGLTGAGRTDAGVHAIAQVAHVDLDREWDSFRLSEALNWHLKPEPIAIVAAERAADDFHARFDATGREYVYRVVERRAPLVLDRGRAWRAPGPVDVDRMRESAAHLIGRHDFTTFRAAQCQALSPIKTLDEIVIARHGSVITFRVAARSFLHNQVRSIVGSLLQVGTGKWQPAEVASALRARDRSRCGQVAPPDGLFLSRVDYPDPAEREGPAPE